MALCGMHLANLNGRLFKERFEIFSLERLPRLWEPTACIAFCSVHTETGALLSAFRVRLKK